MLQGYPEWSHVQCMYYQGYFLHMTTLIWLALIWKKYQQGNSAGYYKLYKWWWSQTISGTEDIWQERICEKFRQPIIRSNLDYVFMQMYNKGTHVHFAILHLLPVLIFVYCLFINNRPNRALTYYATHISSIHFIKYNMHKDIYFTSSTNLYWIMLNELTWACVFYLIKQFPSIMF